jgi:hypothetical protein
LVPGGARGAAFLLAVEEADGRAVVAINTHSECAGNVRGVGAEQGRARISHREIHGGGRGWLNIGVTSGPNSRSAGNRPLRSSNRAVSSRALFRKP